MNVAALRMADWIDSLDHPPTLEEKLAYVEKAKAHPTARVAAGWVLIGPIPDPYEPKLTNIYEVMHESGDYAQTLSIDCMGTTGSLQEERAVVDWMKDHIARREWMREHGLLTPPILASE